ncbi:MAG: 30S ribosomal protein S5, partial [Nitrososphaerota archaeon]
MTEEGKAAPSTEQAWTPRTRLGILVSTGKVTSMEEIFENGWRISEPEIVKTLLPDIKSVVVGAGIVQKQTDAGELTRFSAIVAVGNEKGWLGVGRGKARQMRVAIEKATND